MKQKLIIIIAILAVLINGIFIIIFRHQIITLFTSEYIKDLDLNMGQKCSNQNTCGHDDVNKLSCLLCPSNTTMVIEGNGYSSSRSASRLEEQGYCGYSYNTKCIGEWENGDKYYIKFDSLLYKDCEDNLCVYPKEKLPLVTYLTTYMLNFWKTEVLKTISEDYFNQHFDVENIDSYIELNPKGKHKLIAVINFNFKFDWATTSARSSKTWSSNNLDRIVIAEKIKGEWQTLNYQEMSVYYQQDLVNQHNSGNTKPTEQEITSIISENQASSILKSCNKNMNIDTIAFYSKDNDLSFLANGITYVDAENCSVNENNSFTKITASVDLISGKPTCDTEQEQCTIQAGF